MQNRVETLDPIRDSSTFWKQVESCIQTTVYNLEQEPKLTLVSKQWRCGNAKKRKARSNHRWLFQPMSNDGQSEMVPTIEWGQFQPQENNTHSPGEKRGYKLAKVVGIFIDEIFTRGAYSFFLASYWSHVEHIPISWHPIGLPGMERNKQGHRCCGLQHSCLKPWTQTYSHKHTTRKEDCSPIPLPTDLVRCKWLDGG